MFLAMNGRYNIQIRVELTFDVDAKLGVRCAHIVGGPAHVDAGVLPAHVGQLKGEALLTSFARGKQTTLQEDKDTLSP